MQQRLAFGYVRRSSYKQQENNSVEIQIQHIKEFAQRNKLNVPEEFIFIEDVTSAYSKLASQRKELMRLSNKMLEMNVPIVIFHDASRMDRTGYSFVLEFYRPLMEKIKNLEVYTTKSNDPIDPESPEMKMNFLLFQHESEVKSERALGSLKSDLEGETVIRPGAKIPYGYSQVKKKLFPNENAEIVSFIFFLYSWGHSLVKIASLLNEAHIPSPKGKLWRSSTIENIIKNPVYTGDLTWHLRKPKDGKKVYFFEKAHEPIVNEFSIQLHHLNKQLQEKYGRLDTPFLFLNKMNCQHCQQVLVTQNGSTKRNGTKYQYQYYLCRNCNYKVEAKEVHDKLIPLIFKQVHNQTLRDQIQQSTINLVVRMTQDVQNLILNTEEMITRLKNKINIAQQLEDRELELHILSRLDEFQCELKEQHTCRERLVHIFQTVNSTQFFTRFNDILQHQLGVIEKRLIILYFVDCVLISKEFEPNIRYKNYIFDEFICSLNG